MPFPMNIPTDESLWINFAQEKRIAFVIQHLFGILKSANETGIQGKNLDMTEIFKNIPNEFRGLSKANFVNRLANESYAHGHGKQKQSLASEFTCLSGLIDISCEGIAVKLDFHNPI